MLSNIVIIILLVILGIAILRSIRIVPAKKAFVVERLGKYCKTMEAGFHILVPFIDKVAYKHSLKEKALDVPIQPCFTQDNVKVMVDGVVYMRVVDPKKASYGITKRVKTPHLTDYEYATIQLAQTTMRSVIGKLELDRTFEERDSINAEIVRDVDEATNPWGITVSRYEIQNIKVPDSILTTMEKQMQAERIRRAVILESEGSMEARINRSIGDMEKAINESEGEKQKMINEAEGKASEIRALSRATAISLAKVASAIGQENGEDAVSLQLTESYFEELNNLAKSDTEVILPVDMTNIKEIENRIKDFIK
ncbi:SPFH domain-containing protein [Spirochaeta isovalerica]|uniref:Regulator of protease activity HflC (Stomatin/prohibitin superfamily) n=1 Tax=Spirochaeta isovalerica TaxID=150 RepID=A0A841RHS7_9SPIO|nr:stomatin-like protein [Spirochaeta isovalerica]MBB6482319.1 regulator of protease activity HflC (stomatin/prohibitin superfamily) [Spirochaeta isovalerica]